MNRKPTLIFDAHDVEGFIPRNHAREYFEPAARAVVSVSSFDAHRMVNALLEAAMHEAEGIELAGLNGDEEVADPYMAVLGALEDGLRRARALQGHAHDWTSGDYCSICGADGRA